MVATPRIQKIYINQSLFPKYQAQNLCLYVALTPPLLIGVYELGRLRLLQRDSFGIVLVGFSTAKQIKSPMLLNKRFLKCGRI